MTKKSVTITAPPDFGRDAGKLFVITEMAAEPAEKWALRMFLCLKGTTAEVPQEIERLGMIGVAIRGVNAFLAADIRWNDFEPLLDQMFTCVARARDPQRPDVVTPLIEGDIEEVKTRIWLRSEVLSLHVGFSVSDAFWTVMSMVASKDQEPISPTM